MRSVAFEAGGEGASKRPKIAVVLDGPEAIHQALAVLCRHEAFVFHERLQQDEVLVACEDHECSGAVSGECSGECSTGCS